MNVASSAPPDAAVRRPFIGVGVGSGLNARAAEQGGADLLACYSTAVYRANGLPSILSFLPYDDCNRLAMEAFGYVRACCKTAIPKLIGLGVHDPRLEPAQLLEQAFALGADGMVNEPFLGGYGKLIKTALDREGLGFQRELAALSYCVAHGRPALGWAFDAEQCRQIAAAGVPYVGLMLEADAGQPLQALAQQADELLRIARRENPQAVVLLHGKPFEEDETLRYVLAQVAVNGYFTGSSLERNAVTKSIVEKLHQYKEMTCKEEHT